MAILVSVLGFLARFGVDDVDVGQSSVGYESLFSVDDVVVSFAFCRGFDSGGV